MSYRLTTRALLDLDTIFDQGWTRYGHAKALDYVRGLESVFETLSLFPQMARERTLFDPPVRILPFRSHLIIYMLVDGDVVVIRLPHGREDWQADPESRDGDL